MFNWVEETGILLSGAAPNEARIPPSIKRLVAGATLVLPAAILVAPHLGEASYVLLALLGVYWALWDRPQPRKYRRVLLLSLLTLGFYAVALPSAFVSINHPVAMKKLWNLREFLAAPFIGLLLVNSAPSARFIMLGVKTNALVVFMFVFFQFLEGAVRPAGAVNPLVFGILSLLLGFFSIVRFPLESTPQRFLSLAAFFSGCAASVISQSRAVWALSVFLLASILFVWHRSGHLTKRIALGTTTVFLALVLISSQTPLVQQRIHSALDDFHSLRADAGWDNSLGQRVIMWESGLSAAMEKPFLGWGMGQTQLAAAAKLADPEMQCAVLEHNHLHNEYLTNLVAKGLPGLLSVLLMLFVPLVLFLHHRGKPELLVYKGVGSLLCVGYALSGLTNQAFGDDTLNIFFVFFLALTLPRCGLTHRRVDSR